MTKKDQKHKETAPEAQPEQVETQPEVKSKEQELTEQLQRLQAEFHNYRKRIETEHQSAAEKGKEKLLKEFLNITDSMELAIKHSKDEADKQGLELIYNQLIQLLESNNIQRMPTEGKVDPRLHEVYITETNDTVEPNTILETLQHGYTRSGTVLRTAKVKAARRNT